MSGPRPRARTRLWWIVGAILALPFVLLLLLFAAMILYGLNLARSGEIRVLDFSDPPAAAAPPASSAAAATGG